MQQNTKEPLYFAGGGPVYWDLSTDDQREVLGAGKQFISVEVYSALDAVYATDPAMNPPLEISVGAANEVSGNEVSSKRGDCTHVRKFCLRSALQQMLFLDAHLNNCALSRLAYTLVFNPYVVVKE